MLFQFIYQMIFLQSDIQFTDKVPPVCLLKRPGDDNTQPYMGFELMIFRINTPSCTLVEVT